MHSRLGETYYKARPEHKEEKKKKEKKKAKKAKQASRWMDRWMIVYMVDGGGFRFELPLVTYLAVQSVFTLPQRDNPPHCECCGSVFFFNLLHVVYTYIHTHTQTPDAAEVALLTEREKEGPKEMQSIDVVNLVPSHERPQHFFSPRGDDGKVWREWWVGALPCWADVRSAYPACAIWLGAVAIQPGQPTMLKVCFY